MTHEEMVRRIKDAFYNIMPTMPPGTTLAEFSRDVLVPRGIVGHRFLNPPWSKLAGKEVSGAMTLEDYERLFDNPPASWGAAFARTGGAVVHTDDGPTPPPVGADTCFHPG
jgi:hypothetical protein